MVQDLISVFFPDLCPGCRKNLHKNEQIICSTCISELPVNKDYSSNNFTARIWWGRIPVAHSLYYTTFDKGGVVQNLLHEIKYRGRKDVANELGKQFGYRIKSHFSSSEFSCLIPVPLHWKKLKRRGYNQSLEIAEGMGEVLEIPVCDIIERKKATATQTAKSRIDRMKNLENAFKLKSDSNSLIEKPLLIDDVVTTGATLESLFNCLSEANPQQISIGTIAYAR